MTSGGPRASGGLRASGGPRVEVLPARAWAAAVAAVLADRLAARPAMRICLPSGETPAPFYAALVAAERRGAISFADATLVMLDEWLGLPPGDPARGEEMLRRQLVDRLRVPPARFVTIAADEPDPVAAAARHDAEAAGLDLAILGLGINGHVGFNEPGSGPDDPTRVVELAATSVETAVARYGAGRRPTAGITIGLARLLESREVWLLATGRRKTAMLSRVLGGPEGRDCPASYLPRHPCLTVFADEAAAGLPGGRCDPRDRGVRHPSSRIDCSVLGPGTSGTEAGRPRRRALPDDATR